MSQTLLHELSNGGWETPSIHEDSNIRRYSTTGDILSYQRCRRQYGFFTARGFSSATATQRYFGTLVHDVLDQINRNYKIEPVLPGLEETTRLIENAHDRLIRSGVKPYNASQQDARAIMLIQRFVELVGPYFFRHVQRTEYRLESALQTQQQRQYILEGIVDILAGAVSHELNLPYSTESDDIEIWDYKSGRAPQSNEDPILRSYQYQMRVYLELFRQQTGRYPARAVLVFLGELGRDGLWNEAQGDPSTFSRLFYVITPDPNHIDLALNDFHNTVDAIEHEKSQPYAEQWQAPEHDVDIQTCEACEIRYNCPQFERGEHQRNEPL